MAVWQHKMNPQVNVPKCFVRRFLGSAPNLGGIPPLRWAAVYKAPPSVHTKYRSPFGTPIQTLKVLTKVVKFIDLVVLIDPKYSFFFLLTFL